MSHAQMIAKAWLDDSYRMELLARGIEVPPPPNDLADEELVTSAMRDGDDPVFMSMCAPCNCF